MDEHLKNEEIIAEAKKRFKQCVDWESYFRANYRFDKRFDAGNSVNNYQWPNDMYSARNRDSKPCLTVNKVHEHVLHVTNDAKQNKPGIKISPVGNGATFKAGEILEGIVRHIEYVSNATEAYDTATKSQVIGGIGWWRVVCDYESDDSFDQSIFIRRIADAMSVYLDPDIKEFDGSDARYGFVFKDMPKDEFDLTYPEFEDIVSNSSPLGQEENEFNWFANDVNDHVRVLEYYRKVDKPDKLHLLADGTMVKESEAKEAHLLKELRAASIQSREIMGSEIEWYLIACNEIIDKADYPGKYIPLVRIIGEEQVIDGTLDRHGLVRAMIDSQRIYNVSNSAAVEYIGLQTKVPWKVAIEAIEGYETYWDSANTENHAYLPWNALNDAGQAIIPEPSRTDPPIYAAAYQQALVQAAADMQSTSGIFDAQLGQSSNERSGKAINERVRNGDTATFHFINNLSIGVKFTGKIILDLIPKVFDVPRTLKILGQDGTQMTVALDPSLAQAHVEHPGMDYESFSPQAVAAAINPMIGQYDVEADVGPSYGTKRQETWNAISQILEQNESLTPIIGDLLFRAADFPLSDEIANRMQQHFNSQADPNLQQAQQMLAQQHQVMAQQGQEIEQLKSKAMVEQLQKDIDWYKAETDRLKAVGSIDPAALMPVVRQLVSELLGTPVNPIIAAHTAENAAMINAASPNPTQGTQN